MRLVRLYANQPDSFAPIEFNVGVSAILAEIRLPANRGLDTHNLGKTTVGALIDFCLLKNRDREFFLFKHQALFAAFAFYLEIELAGPTFVTIRRRVVPGSRIDFMRSDRTIADATGRPDEEWDHLDVPFDRARTLLDGILSIDILRPWPFRKLVGYLIRSQRDYQDVFQLGKFSGKHQDWKPFVAHLLGAQSGVVADLYDKRAERDQAQSELGVLVREWGPDESDPSLIDGLISAKRRSIAAKEEALNAFNFRDEDQRTTAEVVDRLDDRIVSLNDELYDLRQLVARIEDSLDQRKIMFDPESASKLFAEAGVSFEGQLKRDFAQLIQFNLAITDERSAALSQQRAEARARIDEINLHLADLNEERARSLAYLRETDSLAKYKKTSRDLSQLQAELAVLEQRREAAARLVELRRRARTLSHEFDELQTRAEDELAELSADEDSRFGRIRRFFAEIIGSVIGEQAILSMTLNGAGGVDFRAELMGASGVATSGDKGTSYRKLLCIAFDLAVLRAYLDVTFPRFVYLDGALEQLEPRKRENLIAVFREYASIGVQPILSLLDSDLPAPLGDSRFTLAPEEVVLTLHDEGESGRLFKMPSW